MKEIHFYTSETYLPHLPKDCIHGYQDTLNAIKAEQERIDTTQMCLLSTVLFKKEYRIFVHNSNTDLYEIELGDRNRRTNRMISPETNLLNLWLSGEFELKS